jgi:uncharacterized protein YqeY
MSGRPPEDDVRSRLRRALTNAMKARDPIGIAAFRTVLAALDNAEAADLSDAPTVQHGRIAGGVAGLGTGDVPRSELTEARATEIARAHVIEWRTAAGVYERSENHDRVTRLRAEADALAAVLADETTRA